MPKITAEEKETATLIPLDRIFSDMDDTEVAFNSFRESFQTGEEPGTVRAWELLIDDRGNIGTTRTQTRLGSWPVDAYTMDELCQMLIDQYMTPDQHRMAVRLVGSDPKKSGFAFNKIVMLKRAFKKESSSDGKDSTASIMKMMQENNERIMSMVQRMQAPPAEKPDTAAEIQKMMAFAQAMNAPMLGVLQTLLPALAGRPAPAQAAGDPFGSLGSLLDVAERLSDMRGGGGSSDKEEGFAGILRAITPLAKPALEAIPALAAMQAANRPAPRVLPAAAPAAPRAPTAPGAAPTPPPRPASTVQPTDIPSGDSEMLAQLKPQIDSLVQMAEQGSDASGAADLIFDNVFLDANLPDAIYEKLADFIESPQFVNYCGIMNPAAKTHMPWFEAFKTQIVARLLAEDASAGQAPTAVEPHHPV